MKQMGLSVSAISELTGYDRKTVRKYLLEPEGVPSYVARAPAPSRLDRHKPYLQDRLADGVRNAQVLLREIRALGYDGSYTILKDWLHPQRSAANAAAVRRFQTPPGKQAQVNCEISTRDNLESPVMERGFSDEEYEAQRRADDRCGQAA